MRNLKRALSLTLASVMLLGMMVVGSSAAAGYDDVKETDNVEAIEVLQAIGVMVGDERGFGPDRPVNRAEMAVVMSLLLNLDYNYYVSSCPFNDVYDWARGPVGACYANKIVSGRGEGVYDPGSTVTAVEAASMLMRALGYFQYSNDYEGGFELATVRQGSRIGIFNGVGSSATEAMTRNQVAQMVLNALQTGMAEPDGNTINLTTPDGSVLTGKVNYVNVTSAKTFAHAISWTQATSVGSTNDGWIVELGEQLYDGKLELRDNTLDVFGRPARTWIYDGTEIGTYAKRELMVASYTTGVSGRTLYEKLTQATIRDYDLDTYTDGSDVQNGVVKGNLVRSNSKDLEDTGRGVLTEVYVDNDLEKITIVSINTFLAQANSDYNETSETVSLSVYYGLDSVVTTLVDKEDVAKAADIKKDDWVLINWADESAQPTNKVVQIISEPEIMVDQTVTAFSRNNNEDSGNYDTTGDRVTEITTGGTTYKNNANAWYKKATLYDYNADKLVNKTYTLYMDQYGNFIGAELYSGKDQYVFITGYDRPTSNLSVSTANAAAIFPDGRMEVISVNVKDTNDNIRASWRDANGDLYTPDTGVKGEYEDGDDVHYRYNVWAAHGNDGEPKEEMWYTYTVKNDVYTLTPAKGFTKQTNDTAAEESINCSNVRLTEVGTGHFGTGRSYGEDASVYITVRTGNVDSIMGDDDEYNPSLAITEVNGLYTGVQNVNLTYTPGCWVHSVYDPDDNNMIIAAVILGEAEGIVDNYAYIRKGAYNERYDAESDTHYWKIDVILGGELKTMEVKSRFTNTIRNLVPGAVQELVLDADGYVTKVNPATKVYDAPDWNATTHGSVDVLKGFDIYDIDSDDTNVKVGTTANGDNYVNPVYQGHTLYINSGSEHDAGLEFVSDAKAVVYQWRNNDDDYYVYNDVKTAVDNLADASTSVAGKQFDGRIVAVLNSDGVAEWVLFIDRTPINSTDPNFGGNTPGQLPAISEMPVTPTVTGATGTIGRYANGKLYIQFNGLASAASEVAVSGLTVTEAPSGRTHYLDNLTIEKTNGQTYYVWNGDLALRSETNGLTVTGTAATAEWYVDYSGITGVTVTEPATTAAEDDGTFDVVINKPAGAAQWSYTWTTGGNVDAASVGGSGLTTATAVTGVTADSVTVRFTKNTAGRPAPTFAVSTAEWGYTFSAANATFGTGIVAAVPNTTTPASLTHNTSENLTVNLYLANNAAAGDRVVVSYTEDNTAKTVNATVGSDLTAGSNTGTATIAVTATATKAITITGVTLQKSFAAINGSTGVSAANMTTAGTWKLYKTNACAAGDAIATTDFFNVGDTVYVQITPHSGISGAVHFTVDGHDSADVTTADPIVMPYVIKANGAQAIGTPAATDG